MEMNKVKIKSFSGKRPDRVKLLNTLSTYNVKYFKVQEIRSDGFLLWCNSDKDVDLLFSDECESALKQLHCEPQLPPEVRAKRTVLLRHVDSDILGKEKGDIIAELEEYNSWLSLVDIYVFQNAPTVKLVCSTNEMAKRVLNSGVLLFNLSIPPGNVIQEEFVYLSTCYRCYAIDDHMASSCSKPKDYKVCSVCAAKGHTFKQCTSNIKKCLNCGGPHSALAMSCPDRKQKVWDRKKCKQQQKSYASAVGSSWTCSSAQPSLGDYSVIAKAFMCISLSTMKNAETPGSFQTTLTHLLKVNGLPDFSMGDISPPSMQCLLQCSGGQGMYTDEDDDKNPLVSTATSQDNVTRNDNDNNDKHSTTSMVVYKKKSAPRITPDNVRHQYSTGAILIDCSTDTDLKCLQLLSTADNEDFSKIVTIHELKVKEFDQKAGLLKSKRSLRNVSSSQPI